MHRFVLPMAALAMSAVVAVPVFAQGDSGTPVAEEETSSRIISPEECQIDPLPADELYDLLGLGEGEAVTPDETNLGVPLGEPAPNDVREALDETTREWIACLNASDNQRIAALLTDGGTVDYFGDQSNLESAAADDVRAFLAGTPTPRPEDRRIRYIALTDSSILEDGRAAAFVVLSEPAVPPSGPETLLLVFSEQDGRWLIDGFVDFTIVTPTAATPEAGASPEASPEA